MPQVHKIGIPPNVSKGLRGLEFVLAAVAAGIMGYYLYPFSQSGTMPASRFIFAEVWAGISIIISVVWLFLPKYTRQLSWFTDFAVSVGWWVSFGLIVAAIDCGSFFSTKVGDDGFCRNWRAVQVFCFISAIAWIVTGLFGIQFIQQKRRGGGGGGRGGY